MGGTAFDTKIKRPRRAVTPRDHSEDLDDDILEVDNYGEEVDTYTADVDSQHDVKPRKLLRRSPPAPEEDQVQAGEVEPLDSNEEANKESHSAKIKSFKRYSSIADADKAEHYRIDNGNDLGAALKSFFHDESHKEYGDDLSDDLSDAIDPHLQFMELTNTVNMHLPVCYMDKTENDLPEAVKLYQHEHFLITELGLCRCSSCVWCS